MVKRAAGWQEVELRAAREHEFVQDSGFALASKIWK